MPAPTPIPALAPVLKPLLELLFDAVLVSGWDEVGELLLEGVKDVGVGEIVEVETTVLDELVLVYESVCQSPRYLCLWGSCVDQGMRPAG